MGVPFVVCPVAPSGEQNAPGCTTPSSGGPDCGGGGGGGGGGGALGFGLTFWLQNDTQSSAMMLCARASDMRPSHTRAWR